jgi:lipopolysaccharide/colanic/teichoic acid biosynthesis glycosyltransferase
MTTTDSASATLATIDSAAGLSSPPPVRPADTEPRRAARTHDVRYIARVAALKAPSHEVADEVALPRTLFGAQLRREMRRADRSGTPLSLVIFRLQQASSASRDVLLSVLLGNKRETDIVGDLGADRLAVICTDTGSDGAARFIQKVDAHLAGMPYVAEPATYPDQLFEGLLVTAAEPVVETGSDVLAEASTPTGVGYSLKRPLDVLGALLALLLLSPLMLVTALAVRLGSPGPVIYRQARLGRGGRTFSFYKFRSMYVDRDDRIHREFVANLIKGNHTQVDQQSSDAPVYKIKADPRVTPVGRFIRRTSLDELPQLFNVLKGEMSLVGPRPPLPYEAENYRSWHLRRVFEIRPGITGLWQVEGRSKVTFDEMVRMDLRYIRNCSLSLDLRLLLKTALVVFKCDGAT